MPKYTRPGVEGCSYPPPPAAKAGTKPLALREGHVKPLTWQRCRYRLRKKGSFSHFKAMARR